MKHQPERESATLDDAITAVRADELPSATAAAAEARVWERLAPKARRPGERVETIRGCADVQALLPAHRQGLVEGPRAVLVEDHLRECATCRASFREPGAPHLAVLPWRPVRPEVQPERRSGRTYLLAASVLLAIGLSAFAAQQAFFAVPPGSRVAVQSVSGSLQRVAADRTPVLQPGAEAGEAEALRTTRGSQAMLRLRDGSIVEMDERAELSVTARGLDTTIHLERGSIIVQAAKRRSGHLLVASKDCTVYVTGTTFSVNRGLKGSRVSVIEGRVRVVRGGDERVLAPGEQWASSLTMGTVPVRDEIAWSRHLDQHLALLGEIKALREMWDTVRTPGLRYESRLLHLLPEGAVVFASVPNYGQALADAHRLFEERLQVSPVLHQWWQRVDPARHGGPGLATVIDKVRSFSDFLGDEVAFAVVENGHGRQPVPLLLAEVRRPGLREFLEAEVSRLAPEQGRRPLVRILDEGEGLPEAVGPSDVFVILRSDLMVISGDPRALQVLARRLEAGGGFDQTAFGQRIAAAYRDGVGLLFAADLERITAAAASDRPNPRQAEVLHQAGIDGLRHLIVEHKDVADGAQTKAVLAFAGARRGIASWLAAPAPMGALDFISPNAQALAAFVAKSPALVLDDVLGLAMATDVRASKELADLESRLSLRLRDDLALALGGEFALALDGPILPTPAWKLVAEVYDSGRLQTSLQVLVTRANDEAARTGGPGLRLEAEQVGGETYYSMRAAGLPFEVHYAFNDGYVVAAPSRALVMQAIRTHETGDTLGRSVRFRSLFPPDRHDHVSGLVYQNFGPLVGSLVEAPGFGQLSADQRRSIQALAGDAKPTLLCAYGEDEAIQVAGIGGMLDLDPTQLALPLLLEHAISGTGHRLSP